MRKFIVVILTFVLILFLNILILNIGLKEVIPNNVNGDMIKNVVIDNLTNKLAENFDDDIKDEIVLKIKNSKDIDQLLDDAVTYIIDTTIYGKKETLNVDKEKLIKLSDEITDMVIEKYLSSKNLPIENLTDEQLEMIKERLLEEFNKSDTLVEEYTNAINTSHDEIYKVTKPYIGIFNRLISTSLKIILILGILLIILLDGLLLKSWYKWMLSFSISGLLSSIPYAFVFPPIIKKALSETLKEYSINLNLNLTSITTPAYVILGISGVLLIAYIFISLIKRNNDDFNIEEAS